MVVRVRCSALHRRAGPVPSAASPERLYGDDGSYEARAVPAVTLEEILERYGVRRIDILKLDCEGSEISILRGCSDETLARIGRIIGEYHDRAAFKALVGERFSGWQLRTLSDGDVGTFWLWREGA